MAIINYVKKEVVAKVVYYGPGLCGKTTNLVRVHENMGQNNSDSVGSMQSLATESDRTLFFDFVPIQLGKIAGFEARFQLFTVPGQVFYNETRRIVLKDCDGIVFIADSQPSALVNNIESLQNLEENLASHGKSLDGMPWVLQYNKQDLPDAMTATELEEVLNNKYNTASLRASAFENWGVMETLAKISSMVLEHLRETMANPKASVPKQGVKRTYSKETVDDDAVVGDLLTDIATARAGQSTGVASNSNAGVRADGTIPGGQPVETSSIKPEDLLAEFEESSGPAPPPPSAAAPAARMPPPPPPVPARSAAPSAQTAQVSSPPPIPDDVLGSGATQATKRAPSAPPGASSNPNLLHQGRTAEDLLASLDDDPVKEDELSWEGEPSVPMGNGGNGGLALDGDTRMSAPSAVDAGDSTSTSMRAPTPPPAAPPRSPGVPPPPPPIPGDASENDLTRDMNPFQAQASAQKLHDATGRQNLEPPVPPPPPPVQQRDGQRPAPPEMTGVPVSRSTAQNVPSLTGAAHFSLVEAGPAITAAPGQLEMPLTLKDSRDGSLHAVTLSMSAGDLPRGGSKAPGSASGKIALVFSILAAAAAGAALALTLIPDL